ncbi:WG repeat-containing protein [Emticicia sp. C21]|uniref:WG repeat-containing protein n=1 Tax=Emticicia sp. C21 TaxID=2302915 RepID=UPI000E3504B9|nr:WG repeat-containing protein [Emticicia sp. C21]RFS15938.1 hypothetical protein D0T08_13615 [Emticicia sp. C21]
MKKIKLLIFFCITSTILWAQSHVPENLYPAEIKEGFASYINKKGELIFTLDSLASKYVEMNRKYYNGYLTYYDSEKRATIIIDNKGKTVREIWWLRIYDPFNTPFQDSVAVVSGAINPKMKGAINFEGKILIPLSEENKDLIYAGEGLFVRRCMDKMEFIDKTGQLVFSKPAYEAKGQTYNFRFHNGVARFNVEVKPTNAGDRSVWKQGLMDTKGNVVLAPVFQFARSINEGKIFVGQDEPEYSWFVDKNGKDLFKKKFQPNAFGPYEFPGFSEGLANVRDLETQKAGYIDSTGDWAIPPIYQHTSIFSNGLGLGFKPDQMSQIFDRTGKVILEGYWGEGFIWWDENIIYIGHLGSYFDHKGNLLWEKKVPFMVISSLKQFEKLQNPELVIWVSLSDHEARNLPEKLWKCKNLKRLYLSQYSYTANATKILPANIYNFTELKELHLSLSKLEKLPNGINKLKKLEVLEIRSSKLSKLPADFVNLSNLRQVNLTTNALTSLPEGFEKLKNLIEINIDFNPISLLPEGIYHLPKLESFSFERNFFVNNKNIIKRLSATYPNANLTKRVAVKAK